MERQKKGHTFPEPLKESVDNLLTILNNDSSLIPKALHSICMTLFERLTCGDDTHVSNSNNRRPRGISVPLLGEVVSTI